MKGFSNIILIIAIAAIVIVGGYFVLVTKQPQSTTPTPTSRSNQQELAPYDSGVADLLIVSVSKSDYCHVKTVSTSAGESGLPAAPAAPSQNEQCPPEDRIPSDSETVKVEKIVNYNRNLNANYEALKEGNVYGTNLISRPAKFEYITVPRIPTGPSSSEVVQENSPESGFQGIVNNLYVYAFYSDGSLTKAHEVVLPGFKEGDRIRAQVSFSDGNLSIREYELLQ